MGELPFPEEESQLKLAEFVKVGRENIDGAAYDIWQRDMVHAAQAVGAAPGVSLRFKLWLGEPFKADASNDWRVPCRIKWRAQGIGARRSACATMRLWGAL